MAKASKPAPKGTHKMGDGSHMPDAMMPGMGGMRPPKPTKSGGKKGK